MADEYKEKQHIKVFVRIRPNDSGHNEQDSRSVVVLAKTNILIKNKTKQYVFDKVFESKTSQEEIYNDVVRPLVPDVIHGYNCTVFTYGQTGTGKTYTMQGVEGDTDNQIRMGIIPRAASQIFDVLRSMDMESSVKVSYLELYNEELFDLQSNSSKAIRIFEDTTCKGSVILEGLEETLVSNMADVYKILEQGSERRRIASTLLNSSSSRSHVIFTIFVCTQEDDDTMNLGKLHIVDLAGSENLSKSGAIEKRAREAVNINQSLLTLGRVIKALAEKSTHVPYRESKLTRILQDSLGGHTKTCLVATISSANIHMKETLNTLEYASRAKCIENRPKLKRQISRKELQNQHPDTIEQLQRDNYANLIRDLEAQKIEITNNRNCITKLERIISDKDQQLQTLQASLVEAGNNIEYLANEKKILEKDLVLVKEAKEQYKRELIMLKDFHGTIIANIIDENRDSRQEIETLQAKLDNCECNMKQTCTTDFSRYTSHHQRTITNLVNKMESFNQSIQDTMTSVHPSGSINSFQRRAESLIEIKDTTVQAILEPPDERISNVNLLKNSQTNLSHIQSKMNDVESLDNKHDQALTSPNYPKRKDKEPSPDPDLDLEEQIFYQMLMQTFYEILPSYT